MEFPRIVLKTTDKNFSKLVTLGTRLVVSLTSNALYPSPNPTLVALTSQIDEVVAAIGVWGEEGSRGSHDSYVDLCNKATTLHLMIKQMGQYVSNTAETSAGTDYSLLAALLST